MVTLCEPSHQGKRQVSAVPPIFVEESNNLTNLNN